MTDPVQASDPRELHTGSHRWEPPTLWGLIGRHKRVSAAVIGVLLLLVGIVVAGDLGARVSRISDTTPCSVWSSATGTQRDAYAALYVEEHGPLSGGASDAATIETQIDYGCQQAYGFDEADTVNVLQAIRHQY